MHHLVNHGFGRRFLPALLTSSSAECLPCPPPTFVYGDWRLLPLAWNMHGSEGKPRQRDQHAVAPGLLSLIAADVLRPGLAWLIGSRTPKFLAAELARVRDPSGFAAVSARAQATPVNLAATGVALHRIAAGGLLALRLLGLPAAVDRRLLLVLLAGDREIG